MTARLVGLISLVLLSSLVLCGLFLLHFQAGLMTEVEATAASAGQAMLRAVAAARSVEPRPREVVAVDAADGRTVIELDGATIVSDSAEPVPGPLQVDASRVRAERDPDRGLVLRIPAEQGRERAGEIVVPVRTPGYAALFATFQRRSLAAFAMVLAAGIVLSAVIAARVTRPIRALDDGLRRISDGDLSVEVDARGSDEVARLGAAFNAMVRRLRDARDRDRELSRRDRLASLGRLAAGVAHDVRNPLHAIGLTLAHLKKAGRPETADRSREFDASVALIGDEIRRLDRLVESFVRFSRSEAREAVEADLGEVVREVARLCDKDAVRRGIDFNVRVDAGVPPIPLHQESNRSAILNLVLNSFEAMPGGGSLSIGVGSETSGVVLEVADSGRGIPPEDREKVFDFGYSGRADGSGLGLAMVHHAVVEEHGGRVDLASTPGKGTTVRITLPRGSVRT